MSDAELLQEIEFKVAENCNAYRGGEITRQQLDARMALLQETTRKLRMPNQNYVSGFISGYFAAKQVQQ